MAMVAPPHSWSSRDAAVVLNSVNNQSTDSSIEPNPSMPPNHLTPPAVPEDITCLVTTGPILSSREPLPQSVTPVSQANSSQSGSSQIDKSSNIECVVCGDKSSGKHYGQFTCEVTVSGTEHKDF